MQKCILKASNIMLFLKIEKLILSLITLMKSIPAAKVESCTPPPPVLRLRQVLNRNTQNLDPVIVIVAQQNTTKLDLIRSQLLVGPLTVKADTAPIRKIAALPHSTVIDQNPQLLDFH